jgi:hypothetical protein
MFITKKEACSILKLKRHSLNNVISSGVIKSIDTRVDSDSVYEYKKELDERRNTNPAKWVYVNDDCW